MNAAVWYVNHSMGAGFKQPELGCSRATADGESGAVPKSGGWPRNDPYPRQAVRARQLIQRTARGGRDARLAEPWAAGAWRPVWADLQQSFTGISNPPSTGALSPFLSDESILLRAMGILIQLSTSITSPVFFEDRVSMLFAPDLNRMRIDFNVCRRVVSMAPAHRRG